MQIEKHNSITADVIYWWKYYNIKGRYRPEEAVSMSEDKVNFYQYVSNLVNFKYLYECNKKL